MSLTETCSGPSSAHPFTLDRRGFLRTTLGGALGLAIPWYQAAAAATTGKAKACILLWMNGGPSHIDTFDPKPGARTGGSFKAIDTAVKGLQFSEHLLQVAALADKLAVIRSMTSREGNHDRGQYLAHTGYIPTGTLKHPSLGAWVSHELGDPKFELPNFVSIRGPSFGASFLGVTHNPFFVQNPGQPVQNLSYAADVDKGRFDQRLSALKYLQSTFTAETHDPRVANHGAITDRAVRMMRSPLVKSFDISPEPAAVKKMYGETDFGRGCLMARRLVQAGVKFVEVVQDGWDTHQDNFNRVKSLLGQVDPGMAGLIKDLAVHKLLDSTLVIWMGEFGRTPRITSTDGRDHHPAAFSAVLAGGGVNAGTVYGSTDAEGDRVARNAVTTPDFFATVATLMGIDPTRTAMSPVGRPISISDNGKVIKELIG
jgi:uncharacterized protein (DUF1501 family)